MNIQQLRHITVLAEAGSFARASAILSIPQPVLSRSIKTIEERYGIRLFDRGRFGAVLTPAGHSMLREMQEIVRRSDTLHQEMTYFREGSTERVRFGAAQLPGRLVLGRLLTRVATDRPTLGVDAVVESVADLITMLAQGDLEFAVCFEHTLPAAGIRIEKLCAVRTSFVVRAGHPLLGRDEVRMTDIYAYPIVMGQGTTSGLEPTILCGSHTALREMTRDSDAIWPTAMLAHELETDFVELKVKGGESHYRDIVVATSLTASLSSPARYLCAELRNVAWEISKS